MERAMIVEILLAFLVVAVLGVVWELQNIGVAIRNAHGR